MSAQQVAVRVRDALGQGWVVAVFGTVYVISQFILGTILDAIGPADFLRLQTTATTAEAYVATFTAWESRGLMPFYRAHLIFDGIHWLWYAIALAGLLGLAQKRAQASAQSALLLAIPVIAGLCDLLENTLQHVFLSDPGYATIVDPLPLVSTMASITKWSLAGLSLLLIAYYLKHGSRGRAPA